MKVLLVYNNYKQKGGEEVVARQEFEALQRVGVTTELYWVSNEEKIQSATDVLRTAWNINFSQDSFNSVRQTIRRFRPDIVHVHNFFPLITPAVFDACRSERVPTVMTLHNYRPLCAASSLSRNGKNCDKCLTGSPYFGALHGCYRNSRFASLAVGRLLSHMRRKRIWSEKIDSFIALTEFAKSQFVRGGWDPAKIYVKPNFMEDPIAFKPRNEERFKKPTFALFVGRLSGEKGIRTMIDAWKGIDLPLKLVGDGPMRKWVELNKPAGCQVKGELSHPEVFEEMRNASLLIAPSECLETFSLSTMEAYGHGLPVIASNLGSLQELVSDGETGRLFESRSPASLKRVVNESLSDLDNLQKMSDKSRDFFVQRFTPEKHLGQIFDIYERTIQNNRIARQARIVRKDATRPGFPWLRPAAKSKISHVQKS